MEKTVRIESGVRLIVSPMHQFAGEPKRINFTAIFKCGNFCHGSISSEGDAPVQARFPQLGIAVQFDRELKPVLPTEIANGMREELKTLLSLLSEALGKDSACNAFMKEHGFRSQRLD